MIAENLHRNFIDHAEYPQTAEIEQRCIRMLAELFNAPGETTGARTQGSSEAIMLGALSLKWKWRQRREAEGKATDKPNLVFGGDVHVVWEKFCRYFDVEPRIVPAAARQVHDRSRGRRAPPGREHDRGRGGGGHDIHRSRRRRGGDQRAAGLPEAGQGPRHPASHRRRQRRLRLAFPLPGFQVGLPAGAGALDQRLGPQVRPRLPGDRLADLPRADRPRRGSRLLRELPGQDGRHLHAQLLDGFSHGPRSVLHLRSPRQGGLPAADEPDAGERGDARQAAR